jgi:hypothetical protein
MDGINFRAPRMHVAEPPSGLRVPLRFDPGFDPRRTGFLSRMVERWGTSSRAQERTTAALLRIYRADRQKNGATAASREPAAGGYGDAGNRG